MKFSHTGNTANVGLRNIEAKILVVVALLSTGCGAPTIYRAQPSITTTHHSTQNAESTWTKKDLKDTDSIRRGVLPTEKTGHTKGPFKVATYGYTEGLRQGPDFGSATVYYPVDATAPFASLLIVPGYLHGESSMSGWGPFLASHGFVVMTIGTLKRTDNPFKRRDALLDALTSLRGEYNRTHSPLFQKLDLNRIGVAGWSMGGGGTQLAAVHDPSLRVVMALCPWLPNAQFKHPVPTLIFAGTLDNIAVVWRHARPHYESIPSQTPKLLYEVRLGSHWVGNDPKNADGYIGQVGLSWLKVHLEGDTRYVELMRRRPDNANEYRIGPGVTNMQTKR